MIKRIIILLLLALMVLGCSEEKSTEPPPRSIQVLDDTVVASVKMNLKTDLELASADLEVDAENDLLILRGTVSSNEARERAEELAKKTPRVEKVANHIEVSSSP